MWPFNRKKAQKQEEQEQIDKMLKCIIEKFDEIGYTAFADSDIYKDSMYRMYRIHYINPNEQKPGWIYLTMYDTEGNLFDYTKTNFKELIDKLVSEYHLKEKEKTFKEQISTPEGLIKFIADNLEEIERERMNRKITKRN